MMRNTEILGGTE